jgi:hypothetical protein
MSNSNSNSNNGNGGNDLVDSLRRLLGGAQPIAVSKSLAISAALARAAAKVAALGTDGEKGFTGGDAFQLASEISEPLMHILHQVAHRAPILMSLAGVMIAEEAHYDALRFYASKSDVARDEYLELREEVVKHAQRTTREALAEGGDKSDEENESPTDGEGEVSADRDRAAAVRALLADLNIN